VKALWTVARRGYARNLDRDSALVLEVRPLVQHGLVRVVVLAAAVSAAILVLASGASASRSQVSILQDGTFWSSPATALPQARELGASTIRVFVAWNAIAPEPRARRAPHFDASNPRAYPALNWTQPDTLVRMASEQGITVDLELTGGGPRWAEGANPPTIYRQSSGFGWRPDARRYGEFVHAVTERYDGHFTPNGASAPLPAVHFWSFWNEPNNGQDLGPQAVNGSTKPIGPKSYRALLDAGWRALHQTQPHAQNTILIGELAATGYALPRPGHPGRLPGVTATTRALVFVRALYCLDDRFRPLQGSIAKLYGCPTTAAASRRFRAQHPALFAASGFADHPYASRRPPDANPAKINRDYATFPVLKHVASVLDSVTHAYGSTAKFPIYNDEYGYITSPPQPTDQGYPSPAAAAAELNQAEYLNYKNPRLASYAQYLLKDPPITPKHPHPGFASGLYTMSGKPKATMYAYRMPVWLPKQTVKAGARMEVWGGARPAAFATTEVPIVSIQMQPQTGGSWTTIQTVKVSRSTGYFDQRLVLPHTGRLRLAYTYPDSEPFLPLKVVGSTIHSRTVDVTVQR
jgi:hypothetical protein